MNAKVETASQSTGSSPLDVAKLLLALAAVVGGAVAFNWYSGEWPMWARVLCVLAGLGVGVVLGASSSPGARFIKFLKDAQIEVRKVVWPTRQETRQTTLIVGVAVLLIGILIWIIDMILAWIVRLMMG